MQFSQSIVSSESLALLQTVLLRRGHWLVEAGGVPPPSHRPALMLGEVPGGTGAAVSLRTRTVLQAELGATLIHWLGTRGCDLGALADVALHEIVLNAAIHGNLEVPSGASRNWADLDARAVLVARALTDPGRAGRVITTAIGWNLSVAVVAVADEGRGYEAAVGQAAVGQAVGRAGNPRAAGRGLDIARAVARVEVCDHGRCTRLIFTRDPGTERA
jgi:hypothetical protein